METLKTFTKTVRRAFCISKHKSSSVYLDDIVRKQPEQLGTIEQDPDSSYSTLPNATRQFPASPNLSTPRSPRTNSNVPGNQNLLRQIQRCRNEMISWTNAENAYLDYLIFKFVRGNASDNDKVQLVTILAHREDLNRTANVLRRALEVDLPDVEDWELTYPPKYRSTCLSNPWLVQILSPPNPEPVSKSRYAKPLAYVVTAISNYEGENGKATEIIAELCTRLEETMANGRRWSCTSISTQGSKFGSPFSSFQMDREHNSNSYLEGTR